MFAQGISANPIRAKREEGVSSKKDRLRLRLRGKDED
jgi:hypothetical protein